MLHRLGWFSAVLLENEQSLVAGLNGFEKLLKSNSTPT